MRWKTSGMVGHTNDKEGRALGTFACLALLAAALLLAGCGGCFDFGFDGDINCGSWGHNEPCDEAGATRCSGNNIERCKRSYDCHDSDGNCLEWVEVEDCYSQHCDDSSGEAACVCSSTCEEAGETRCQGTVLQECRQSYYDSCYYWWSTMDCADVDMICISEAGSADCVPTACTEGATRCSESVVETCSRGADDSLSWTIVVDCSANGLACEIVSESGRCTCPSPCAEGSVVRATWEQFGPWSARDYTRDPVDVGGHSIVFTPGLDDPGEYTWNVYDGVTEFPLESGTGEAGAEISGGDDPARYSISVMEGLPFFGEEYARILIDPHGYILFDAGEEWDAGCEEDFFSYPRIAGFMTGALSLAEGGRIVVDEFYNMLAVTYENIPIPGAGITSSFQVIIDAEGTIMLYYLAVDTFPEDGAIVGISSGGKVGAFPPETDFVPCSGHRWCDPPRGHWEIFTDEVRSDYPDLGGHEVVFTPDASDPNGYSWSELDGIADFPETPGTGDLSTVLPLHDARYVEYPLALLGSFSFFDTPYPSMFVSSNGSITFGEGDSRLPNSTGDLFYFPRIGGFIAPLDPDAGGSVTVDEFPGRAAVTYEKVAAAGESEAGSFQIVMDSSGSVGLYYLKTPDAPWGAVGIFNGGGGGDAPPETDFVPCSGRPWCQPLFASWESFGGPSECDHINVSGHSITFTPDPVDVRVYDWTSSGEIAGYPFTPGSGTVSRPLAIPDGGFAEVPLSVAGSVRFFGLSYASIFVNADGTITFDEGGSGVPSGFFSIPLIGGFVTDLSPSSGGGITVDEFSDLVVVTYDGVPLSDGSGKGSFQISLDASGVIGLHYVNVALGPSGRAMIGISNAGRSDRPAEETDFIPCIAPVDPDSFRGYWEAFSAGDPPDISGHSIEFTPLPENPNGYTWAEAGGLASFPVMPGTGERSMVIPFDASDTEMVYEYPLGVSSGLSIFDETFDRFEVSSHGSVIFTGTDMSPRVDAFRAPFHLSEASAVIVDELPSMVAVTFNRLLLGESPCRAGSFQVVFHDTGGIGIHYLMIDRSAEGEIGLSNGGDIGTRPAETDFIH